MSLRPFPFSLGEIFRRAGLTDDLSAVERRIFERVDSHVPLVSEAGAHTMAAGGKRLRAALVLLSARLAHYDLEHAIHPAVAVELLHAATLVHDDLVDNAGRRRGRVTVHARWNQDVALMLGDFLFGLSADELAIESDPRVVRYYATAAQTIVEGELSPVTQLEPLDVALAQYRYKTGAKTAVLFEAACKAGMAVAGGSEADIAAVGRFGFDLGVAFQIVDDVLDFTGDEATLGKPAGNDLREGTLTLPLIYAVAQSDDPLLRTVSRNTPPDREMVPRLVQAVIAAGGTQRALLEARETIERAVAALRRFPPSSTTEAMADIGAFVLSRNV